MSDMVEKVANSILGAMDIADGLNITAAEIYARAAITAMREPTEVLAIAAFNEIDTEKLTWEEDLAAFWSAAFEGFK
jgi:hypothetical protein